MHKEKVAHHGHINDYFPSASLIGSLHQWGEHLYRLSFHTLQHLEGSLIGIRSLQVAKHIPAFPTLIFYLISNCHFFRYFAHL